MTGAKGSQNTWDTLGREVRRHDRDKDQSVRKGERSIMGHRQRPRKGRAAGAPEGGDSQGKGRTWRPSLVEQGEAVGGENAMRGDVFRVGTTKAPASPVPSVAE